MMLLLSERSSNKLFGRFVPPLVGRFGGDVELLGRRANVVSRGSVLNEQRSAALCLLNTLQRPTETGGNNTTTHFSLHVYILTPNSL